ncbi:hypothetical protein D3C72_2140780 [compost metagenome]
MPQREQQQHAQGTQHGQPGIFLGIPFVALGAEEGRAQFRTDDHGREHLHLFVERAHGHYHRETEDRQPPAAEPGRSLQ